MRIISGKYRGRNIKIPHSCSAKPTLSNVREAIFSSTLSLISTLDDKYALDAFAGSGAFGIECLSRGAKHVDFFELDKKMCNIIKSNIIELDISSREAHLHRCNVEKYDFNNISCVFDVVFFDPPYAYKCCDVIKIIDMLYLSNKINTSSLIIYEHNQDFNFDKLIIDIDSLDLCVIKEKKYSNCIVTYLQIKERN